MSILSYNGAAIMAMKGKDCVVIAADRRFGIQAQTISTEFDKIFEMGPKLFIGLPGLATDVQTVAQRLKFRLNLYELKENRRIKPKTFLSMVSNLLYSRRFGPYFVEPVIAGLDPKSNEPFIACLDLIGCPMVTEDFVVSGTCSEQMYGMCETLFRPNLEPDDLFETISQCLLNAVDRDAVSGWGGVVYIMIITRYDPSHQLLIPLRSIISSMFYEYLKRIKSQKEHLKAEWTKLSPDISSSFIKCYVSYYQDRFTAMGQTTILYNISVG